MARVNFKITGGGTNNDTKLKTNTLMEKDLSILLKLKLKELLVLGAEILTETKYSDDNPTSDDRDLYVHTIGEHTSTIKVTKP